MKQFRQRQAATPIFFTLYLLLACLLAVFITPHTYIYTHLYRYCTALSFSLPDLSTQELPPDLSLYLSRAAGMALMLLLSFQSFFVHALVSTPQTQPASSQTSLFTPPLSVLADDAYSPSPARTGGPHLEKKILIGLAVVVTALAALLVVSMICFWIWRSSKNSHQSGEVEKVIHLHHVPAKRATPAGKKGRVTFIQYSTLERGTNHFHDRTVLGHSRLGTVYRACLEDDTLAAVKRFKTGDAIAERQYQNEMNLLSQIQHPNIIKLRGYCAQQDGRMHVYEYMPNGSLNSQLHRSSRGCALSWHMRIKIAVDTARGLEYLHEHCSPQVIHRDLNSSNILLDSEFNARLTGFGTAVTANEIQYADRLGTGIPGCIAPEYLQDGKLTEKSDVYAFGVILLELLFRRKSVEELSPGNSQSIVTWAIPQLTDRWKLPNIVDPIIKETMDLKHLYQVAAVAVLCVQQEPSYRPLITDVLHSLVPLVPAELGRSRRTSSNTHHGNAA